MDRTIARRLADRAAAISRLHWLAELSRAVGYVEGMRIASALQHAGDVRVKALVCAVALFIFRAAALLAARAAIEGIAPPPPPESRRHIAHIALAPRLLPIPSLRHLT